MISVYIGDDDFESYHAAKSTATKLANQLGIEVTILETDELSLEVFLNYLNSIGLFATKKVVLAKRLFDNKQVVAYLEQNLSKFKDSNLIIWHPDKLDKRKSIVKNLQKAGMLNEFNLGKSWEVEKWVATKLRNHYSRRANQTAQEMVARLGTNKWLLSNQLNQLDLYVAATDEVPDMVDFIGMGGNGDIWTFLDYLRSGEMTKARLELSKLYNSETNEQYLIAMLARELGILRDTLVAQKTGKPESELGLHPFVIKKTKQSLHRFTFRKVAKLTQALLRLDLAIKTGKIDPQVGITLYTLSW